MEGVCWGRRLGPRLPGDGRRDCLGRTHPLVGWRTDRTTGSPSTRAHKRRPPPPPRAQTWAPSPRRSPRRARRSPGEQRATPVAAPVIGQRHTPAGSAAGGRWHAPRVARGRALVGAPWGSCGPACATAQPLWPQPGRRVGYQAVAHGATAAGIDRTPRGGAGCGSKSLYGSRQDSAAQLTPKTALALHGHSVDESCQRLLLPQFSVGSAVTRPHGDHDVMEFIPGTSRGDRR